MKRLGLVLMALLPLQWFVVAQTPLGPARLHQVALFVFAVVTALWMPRKSFGTVVRSKRFLFVALGAFLFLQTLMAAYHGNSLLESFQGWLYFGVFLCISGFFFSIGSNRCLGVVELLRWSAATAGASLMLALVFSMARNGVNPEAVLLQTISAGDPEIFQRQIFKSSFAGYGFDTETVRGNIRHEVFGAVLFATYVSVWSAHIAPLENGVAKAIHRGSILLCIGLLLFSLSRSVLIAAAFWPIALLLQVIRSRVLSGRQLFAVYSALSAAAVIASSGWGLVLWNRFTSDTSSYESRRQTYSVVLTQLQSTAFTGGRITGGLEISSHNIVLDSWLRAGVLAATSAFLVILALILILIKLTGRLSMGIPWLVAIAAAVALPLVRMLTAGGGQIPPVSWATLGFVVGALAIQHRELQAGITQDVWDQEVYRRFPVQHG